MLTICVLCLAVVPLTAAKIIFAVKINMKNIINILSSVQYELHVAK
jgi:hypothetical protein